MSEELSVLEDTGIRRMPPTSEQRYAIVEVELAKDIIELIEFLDNRGELTRGDLVWERVKNLYVSACCIMQDCEQYLSAVLVGTSDEPGRQEMLKKIRAWLAQEKGDG